MMTTTFRYRAARRDGTTERGVLNATDAAAADVALSNRELVPITVQAVAESGFHAGRRLSPRDLALGLRMLASLLSAGLPVSRALAAFEEVAPPSWRGAARTMKDAVRHGDALSSALEQSGLSFPPLIIGITRAGEASGQLGVGLTRAAEVAESSAQLTASLRAALAYPAVLAIIGGLSVAVVSGVILPRFATLVADLGGAMPPLAASVLAAAGVARSAWWPMLIGVVVAGLVFQLWLNDAGGRRAWHAWLVSLPGLGPLRRTLASSRVCSGLAALIEAGVPISAALGHAALASGDSYIEGRVLRARELVTAGASLSGALAETEALTQTARRLARSGEESGSVPDMLRRAAELDAELAAARIKTLVRLLEPALIVFFAAIIALVAAALLQAVYAVRPA